MGAASVDYGATPPNAVIAAEGATRGVDCRRRKRGMMPRESGHTRAWNASRAVVAVLVVAALLRGTAGNAQKFAVSDPVKVWVNKMVPYRNPTESYGFFDAVPWPAQCKPSIVEYHPLSLGELLQGDRLVCTLFAVQFAADRETEEACSGPLSAEDVNAFRRAIGAGYHYDLVVDELPVRLIPLGAVDKESSKIVVFSTIHLLFKHDGTYIIEADAEVDDGIELVADQPTKLFVRYIVKWQKTDAPLSRRTQRYLELDNLLQHERRTHWLSVINAAATVIMLNILLASIFLRTVRRDLARYSAESEYGDLEDEEDDLIGADEERGWKNVTSDVFRFPQHRETFCAVIGAGTQIFVLLVVLVVLASTSSLFPARRGSFATALVVTSAISNIVGGYSSAKLYTQMDGRRLGTTMLLSLSIFHGPIFGIWIGLNIVARHYGSTMALSASAIASVLAIALFVAVPATFAGSVLGRRSGKAGFNAPVRTAKVRREIPKPPFYVRSGVQVLLAGALPFGAVLVELVYVFASIWGHKHYAISGVVVLILALVLATTCFVCIALTYYQLCAENYEWWWNAVQNGGSTGIYLFAYSLFYLVFRSNFSGLLQVTFFLGYMFAGSYACFLMLAAVGFRASLLFLRRLYKSVKCD